MEGGRKRLRNGGTEFWADNGIGVAVCGVFHYGQADVVVLNRGIADDGAGSFDGAKLGVILFSVIQEIPHQKCGSSKCQSVESPENIPIHFNHNPFYIDRWARYAKVEISVVPGFSELSVSQIGDERKIRIGSRKRKDSAYNPKHCGEGSLAGRGCRTDFVFLGEGRVMSDRINRKGAQPVWKSHEKTSAYCLYLEADYAAKIRVEHSDFFGDHPVVMRTGQALERVAWIKCPGYRADREVL